jgi:hypothetical protein
LYLCAKYALEQIVPEPTRFQNFTANDPYAGLLEILSELLECLIAIFEPTEYFAGLRDDMVIASQKLMSSQKISLKAINGDEIKCTWGKDGVSLSRKDIRLGKDISLGSNLTAREFMIQKGQEANALLTDAAGMGDTRLKVDRKDRFEEGDRIIISKGSEHEEHAIINHIDVCYDDDAAKLRLEAPLRYEHPVEFGSVELSCPKYLTATFPNRHVEHFKNPYWNCPGKEQLCELWADDLFCKYNVLFNQDPSWNFWVNPYEELRKLGDEVSSKVHAHHYDMASQSMTAAGFISDLKKHAKILMNLKV